MYLRPPSLMASEDSDMLLNIDYLLEVMKFYAPTNVLSQSARREGTQTFFGVVKIWEERENTKWHFSENVF